MVFFKKRKENREKTNALKNNPALIENRFYCNGCGNEIMTNPRPYKIQGKRYLFCKKCIKGIKLGRIPEALR